MTATRSKQNPIIATIASLFSPAADGSKAQTLAEIDAAIAGVQADIAEYIAHQARITEQIAMNYAGDNAALETEYAKLSARISAANGLIQRLESARPAAEKLDFIQRLEAARQRANTTRAALQTVAVQIMNLQMQIEALQPELRLKQSLAGEAAAAVIQMRREAAQWGLDRPDLIAE